MKKPILFNDHLSFTPNLTPFEILALGAFCDQSGYFRPIYSNILKKQLSQVHLEIPCFTKPYYHANQYPGTYESFIKTYVDRSSLPDSKNKLLNCYQVSAGLSLTHWETSGWIKEQDPYGWIQWYCHFYYGRRIPGYDQKQIARWKTLVSRFNCAYYQKYPKVKQTLLSWAYTNESNQFIFAKIHANLSNAAI